MSNFIGRQFILQKLLCLSLLILVSGSALAGPASKSFQPHRAFYEMTMGSSKGSSEIIGVDGRMIFEWRSTCDAYIVEQRYMMRYQREQGTETHTDTEFSALENKDGEQYKFYVKNKLSDKSSKIEGIAKYSQKYGTGKVIYKSPREIQYKLPHKTMFPSKHTFHLLDAAKDKKKFLVVPVFDGSEIQTAISVSSVIGTEKMLTDPKHPLLSGKYWPIRMAFFSSGQESNSPTHEMTINLHENGVCGYLVLDYFDLMVNMKLVKIE
jgi:hypothetical protein